MDQLNKAREAYDVTFQIGINYALINYAGINYGYIYYAKGVFDYSMKFNRNFQFILTENPEQKEIEVNGKAAKVLKK